MSVSDRELLQIIDPDRGMRGYTTLEDVQRSLSLKINQVTKRTKTGEALAEYRDRLTPGLRANFDRTNSTTIHYDNVKKAELLPLSITHKIQISTIGGWVDARVARDENDGFELLGFSSAAEARKAMREMFDPDECRVVPIGRKPDCNPFVHLEGGASAAAPGPAPRVRPKM